MAQSTLSARAVPWERLGARARAVPLQAQLGAILALGAVLRVWQLNEVGFNSDEAVYSGQAAAIAEDSGLEDLFPVFRAHPLLLQTVLSLGWRLDLGVGFERFVVAGMGLVTVYLVYELGKLLYGSRTGLVAALLMALMPYHVVVTRQVLLDGPMTLFATLTLLLLARFVLTQRPGWLYASGVCDGPHVPVQGDRASSSSAPSTRSLRSLPSCESACGTWPSRWASWRS